MLPPAPAAARNPGGNLDNPPYQSLHGTLHILTLQMKFPDHVEQIVGQSSHFQPSLVGLESVATGLVPVLRVLVLLDPVLHIRLAIVGFHQLSGPKFGVGHDETLSGECLIIMPRYLANHPAALLPGYGLDVPQILYRG